MSSVFPEIYIYTRSLYNKRCSKKLSEIKIYYKKTDN